MFCFKRGALLTIFGEKNVLFKFLQNLSGTVQKVFAQCFGPIRPIFVIILIHKVSFEILDSEKWSYFRYLEGVCSGLCGVLNWFLTNIQFGVGCNSSILPPFRTHQRLNSTITYWDFNYRQSFQRLQVRGSLWRFAFAERSTKIASSVNFRASAIHP